MAKIGTRAELQSVLDGITFGPSGVMLDKMALRWEVVDLIERNTTYFGSTNGDPFPGVEKVTVQPAGWKIRFAFQRPDASTGLSATGYGRWELVTIGASEDSVVKTCWILLELLVRHELMESFLYMGAKLFDPHKTVAQLAWEWDLLQ